MLHGSSRVVLTPQRNDAGEPGQGRRREALLALVAALGLWQLEFAREVVLAAFLIAFESVGVAFALAVGIGSARAIERGWEIVFRRNRKDES
jgi:hypothetical protein